MAMPRKKAAAPTIEGAAKAIHAAIRAIPKGTIASYGDIAARVGLPKHARLVARVLSQLSDPAIPWHRVVRAGDRIAFATGSEGFARQRERLRAEGHTVRDNGQVIAVRRAADLDQELWGGFF